MKYIDISTHPHQNRQCQWPPTTSLHYRLTTTFQNLLRPKDTPRKLIYSYLGKRNNIIKNDLEGEMVVPWSVYLAGLFWRNEYSFELSWGRNYRLIKYTQALLEWKVRIEHLTFSPKRQNNAMARCEQWWTHRSIHLRSRKLHYNLHWTPILTGKSSTLDILVRTELPSMAKTPSTIIIQKWHR